MKISALVVTYNDNKHLRDCLVALKRFDELVVVDIGSTDGSIEIANQFGDRVFQRPWVPAIELILLDIIQLPRNEWILRIDADEVLPPTLVDDLLALEVGGEYGLVAIPFQYYFLNQKLTTTIWGGILYGHRMFHKDRTTLEAEVHRTHICKDGFKVFTVGFTGDNAVAHYWIDSYAQLFLKHERYLKLEGQSRFSRGERFSWKGLVMNTLYNLRTSLIHKSGWRDGWKGWFLSFFYVQYEMRGWFALRKYEYSHRNGQR